MAKDYTRGEVDQHDPKIFRESLGSFGTTTKPGGNQLAELQTKVRQGVKHVELHLMSQGKGQFNEQDVPDKYGFEQRRTIMQLAKLNEQTLSVHGTFDINSFAGLSGQQGFDESQRAKSQKEIDETIKFAAETAKGGAVVFHLHETQLPTPPGELNLPQKYLRKLKKENRAEYDRIMKDHLSTDNFSRMFQDNPELPDELRIKFESLKNSNDVQDKREYRDFMNRYGDTIKEKLTSGEIKKGEEWKVYYQRDYIEKLKNTDQSLVVVGNSLDRVNRNEKLVNISKDGNITTKTGESLDKDEISFLKSKGIKNYNKPLDPEEFQQLRALLLNGKEGSKADTNTLKSLKKKLLWTYDDMLERKNNMRYEADKDFYELEKRQQIKQLELKKKELKNKKNIYSLEMTKIKELERLNREEISKYGEIESKKNKTEEELQVMNLISEKIAKRNKDLDRLRYQAVGQVDYSELRQYNEIMAQMNEQISEIEKKTENTKVLTDEIFYKNAASMGHLGIKALKYQMDLKKDSKTAKEDIKSIEKKVEELEDKRDSSSSPEERAKLNDQINKERYKLKQTQGKSDYEDIDIIKRPLYLAPENIMAGYGYMDSLEEYKAVIRESWDQFAKKLLSNEKTYKEIREEYEKATGTKVKTHDEAINVAKKHIGGTFDNAHAGVWLKYFRKKEGESEEERLDQFNKWLNNQAEEMARDGIVKHFHFNDTQAKDDDHNLLGQGVLDIHDLRERLRKIGVDEALIVEAGGRGAPGNMHMLNAFEIFNPALRKETNMSGEVRSNEEIESERGYQLGFRASEPQGQGDTVSDWVTVQRVYDNRPQFSEYGMSYSSFRHTPPQQGQPKGNWSGTSFF